MNYGKFNNVLVYYITADVKKRKKVFKIIYLSALNSKLQNQNYHIRYENDTLIIFVTPR